MAMKRFSLRLLFAVSTAITLFVGVSQLRRRALRGACDELSSDGYVVSVPSSWQDWIWQRKPVVGRIQRLGEREVVHVVKEDALRGRGVVTLTGEQVDRLRELGVVEEMRP
jgi:hypothetical protein